MTEMFNPWARPSQGSARPSKDTEQEAKKRADWYERTRMDSRRGEKRQMTPSIKYEESEHSDAGFRKRPSIMKQPGQGQLRDVFQPGWRKKQKEHALELRPLTYCNDADFLDADVCVFLQDLAGLTAHQFFGCVYAPKTMHSEMSLCGLAFLIRGMLSNYGKGIVPSGTLGDRLSLVCQFLIRHSVVWTDVLRTVFGGGLNAVEAFREFLNCSLFEGLLDAEPRNVDGPLVGRVKAHARIDKLVATDSKRAQKSCRAVARERAAQALEQRSLHPVRSSDGSILDLQSLLEDGWVLPLVDDVCTEFAMNGVCAAGDRCTRGHNPEIVALWREQFPNGEPDEKVCRRFLATGTCKFEDKCKFRHERPMGAEPEES